MACRRIALIKSEETAVDMTYLLEPNMRYTLDTTRDLCRAKDFQRGLSAKAARYLYGITYGHVFVDSNKRTGWMVALPFLELNGFTLDVGNEEAKTFMLHVARFLLQAFVGQVLGTLVDSSRLTARGIMTEIDPNDMESCYYVEVDELYQVISRTPDEELSDIDNLVVYQGDEIIGYNPKHELREQLDRSRIRGPDTIPAGTPIHQVVEELSKRVDTDRSYLLFVTDEDLGIIGLLNQADLNRWSCYLYSYLILLYVEKEDCDYMRRA